MQDWKRWSIELVLAYVWLGVSLACFHHQPNLNLPPEIPNWQKVTSFELNSSSGMKIAYCETIPRIRLRIVHFSIRRKIYKGENFGKQGSYIEAYGKRNTTNLFKENMQLRMWIRIHCHLKEGNKNVIKDVLERCNNSHFFVYIVEPWKLDTVNNC